jgi:hypothetical protein
MPTIHRTFLFLSSLALIGFGSTLLAACSSTGSEEPVSEATIAHIELTPGTARDLPP